MTTATTTTTETTTENELAPLAEKINRSHRRFMTSLKASLEIAREAGNLLLEAKAKVEAAGERWLPWVQTNCDFSISEAQRYMRIANYFHLLWKHKEVGLDKLSMTQALRFLSEAGTKPRTGRGSGARPFQISSKADFRRIAQKAGTLELPAESVERKFVDEKVSGIVKQVLAMAGKSKLATGENLLGPAQLAAALLEQIKQALDVHLVVELQADTPLEIDSLQSDADGEEGQEADKRSIPVPASLGLVESIPRLAEGAMPIFVGK